MISRYGYAELREKALNGTKEDRLNLFNWFELYGSEYWNGECYDMDDGWDLYPIYQGIGEPDEDGDYLQYEVIDCEIR